MKLIKKIIPLFFIAILSLNLFAGGRSSRPAKKRYAGGHREGDGGIDVILASGQYMPLDSYIETHRIYYPSVCDMMEPLKADGADSNVWKGILNQLILKTYKKLPLLGEILFNSLEKRSQISAFFLMNLEGVELAFTGDHGDIISERWLKNGTIRKRSFVNINIKSWKDFFALGEDDYKYSHLLTRIVHEALIPYYMPRNKDLLGEAVREIIRLAGFFDEFNSPISLKDMHAADVNDYLFEHGIQSELLPLYLLNNISDRLRSRMHSSVIGEGTGYVGSGELRNFKNVFVTGLSSEEIFFGVSKNLAVTTQFELRSSWRIKKSNGGSSKYSRSDKVPYYYFSSGELNNFPDVVYKLLSPEKMIELSELKRKLQTAPVLCK